jgi:hypothetical protein
MQELFSRFDSGELIGLFSIAGGMLISIVAIAGSYWRRVRAAEIAAELKRDMLDRGLSAEEIKTILDAGQSRR